MTLHDDSYYYCHSEHREESDELLRTLFEKYIHMYVPLALPEILRFALDDNRELKNSVRLRVLRGEIKSITPILSEAKSPPSSAPHTGTSGRSVSSGCGP